MKATLANNEHYSGLAIRQPADTGRRWWKGHDGRLQQASPPRRRARVGDACATIAMAGATTQGRQLRITPRQTLQWAMALHTPFQNAVPERPSLDGVAPLQVQAGRLVSSPFGPWYANSPKLYCRRMKLDDARRVGEDEIKQEIAVVTSRHGSEDPALLRACGDMVCRWGLLFLDISSRLRANQAHRVCANGRRTPNGFSSPRCIWLGWSVGVRCESVCVCSLCPDRSLPRRFRCDVDNSTDPALPRPRDPQEEAVGAAVARHPHHVWPTPLHDTRR